MQRARLKPSYFDREPPRPDGPRCEHPGCTETGEYKAPRSRNEFDRRYRMFCLEHVREYNKAWNYCQGMSESEIEAQIRRDVSWDRPTRPMVDWRRREERLRESVLNEFAFFTSRARPNGEERPNMRPRTAESDALAVLELDLPTDFTQIRARYRELVKIHHPDANGGAPAAEEKIKQINQAYQTLKAAFGA